MTRLLVLVALLLPVECCHAQEPEAVAEAWPETTYQLWVPVLNQTHATKPAISYGIASKGWRQFVEQHLAPILGGPNCPTSILVHCPGPVWPAYRDGEPIVKRGRIVENYEFDWLLTTAEGSPRSDGLARWPGLPAMVEDFAATWLDVRNGVYSHGQPIRTEAYTGKIQTTTLEALRESDPEAYKATLNEVCQRFSDAGFAALWVDALSYSRALPATHEGLLELVRIDREGPIRIGTEAYPQWRQDEVAGHLPWTCLYSYLLKYAPPFGGSSPNVTKIERPGTVMFLRGQATPEAVRQVVQAGCLPTITMWDYASLPLPKQQPAKDAQNSKVWGP